MSGSWTHMLLGSLWSFLIVGAVTAGLVKATLWWRRRNLEDATGFDDPNVFALLVASGLLPPLWAGSALVHHLEGGHGFIEETCPSFGLFSGAEVALAAGASALLFWYGLWRPLRRIRADLSGDPDGERQRLDADDPVAIKVAEICRNHPRLAHFADRVVAVTGSEVACATRGLARPHIEVDCEAVEEWADEELVGALLHETAHLRARDPLHQTAIFLTRHWNPFGVLLDDERAAWRYARELKCDADAVHDGADPLSLASALVAAARPTSPCQHPHSVALDGCDVGPIETRVQILLGYAEDPPAPSSTRRDRWYLLLGAMAGAALLLPHVVDAWPMPFHLLTYWWALI